MTQTYAELSIHQNHGGVRIEQPRAIMNLQTERPTIDIERQKGSMEIDQKRSWEAYGIMSPFDMTKQIHSQTIQNVHKTIAKIAQNGDRMAAIHKSTNVISELASERRIIEFPEFQYAGEASFDNVDISYVADKIKLNPKDGSVQLDVEPQRPVIERIPAEVNIQVAKYASLQIEVIGLNFDGTM